MSLLTAPTDRHDLVRVVEVDTIDADGRPKDRRHKRNRQVLLQLAEESGQLFGLAVRVHNRFFNEFVEPTLAERGR